MTRPTLEANREANRRYRERNRELLREKAREQSKRRVNHVTSAASRQAWEQKNPEKRHAYWDLHRALRRGLISRPSECEECGCTPGVNRAGQSLIHAHHEDYDLPLVVKWLCASCHKRLERLETSDALVIG